mmetsp:Transcript_19004/g.44329  ORF Transcript_19004/g.44329 Transcript_19004/m.44329 type:complete len:282 (-) Transcript_19004:300-1145(-)|eukprot:CAMPEP_0178443928 /NCGR_PEP_ID=MMETSP0689_2-20121128/39193_1 /TAXON_ID=160604 /ORGANISM="Amphidinium massartii, Strain CS-259" /LENGTH=281 /DNA_ID=CAMNT_0020068041 /DNA_START=65 /DNA_END=910 /DNA_ORIENTATION=-
MAENAPELITDKDAALEAFQTKGVIPVLKGLISDELRGNRELFMRAVRLDSEALQYASPELKNDINVVLNAVCKHWAALKHASEEMQCRHNVILEAVMQDADALQYADKSLRENRDFILAAIKAARNGKGDGKVLMYAEQPLPKDKEVVLTAMAKGGSSLKYAAAELLGQSDFWVAARKYVRNNAILRVTLFSGRQCVSVWTPDEVASTKKKAVIDDLIDTFARLKDEEGKPALNRKLVQHADLVRDTLEVDDTFLMGLQYGQVYDFNLITYAQKPSACDS